MPMLDPRIDKLASLLINYSCAVKRGENILIEAIDVPHEFTAALVEHAGRAGSRAFVALKSNQINRALMVAGSNEQWTLTAEIEK
jgi:aminopeptidase